MFGGLYDYLRVGDDPGSGGGSVKTWKAFIDNHLNQWLPSISLRSPPPLFGFCSF